MAIMIPDRWVLSGLDKLKEWITLLICPPLRKIGSLQLAGPIEEMSCPTCGPINKPSAFGGLRFID
jgi:hypothetical protein